MQALDLDKKKTAGVRQPGNRETKVCNATAGKPSSVGLMLRGRPHETGDLRRDEPLRL